ncbi:DUF2933 domain-containing protein [Enterococcus avium]|uniref:DUF2933 domain-containing protein n=1 Tax=Enterococcus dongliensis TaxID=2559925 RepID=A0AAW8TP86_9ENTE|nr:MULTISPECIES: DUF2933 domain-containing protein [Enterococcus]MCB6916183.1 DUF2933 domain-containing protein [Enterococcus avium]MCQ4960040.1 DUF2933 domain-containing protein [Enterococcus avium]MDT2387577.1 DUF2933 domain-containing protein [Enterococcus avium]MDT2597719.1 DUF2933 domain-containing protein [Enterococcus dongliensis]MDT2635807.1 DUF2933 domain-containing protein [Enterococcus dongliensis]
MERLINLLPLLLLLICPISMMFMHKGHNHGGHSHNDNSTHSKTEHELEVLKKQTEQLKAEVSNLKNLVKERV